MSTTRSSSIRSPLHNGPTIQARLEVAFPGDVLGRVYPNGRLGGLMMDGEAPGVLGDRVELTVQIQRPEQQFTLVGQLAWARHRGGAKNLKECYGIDFVKEHERLLQFARAELDASAMRRATRLATHLKVRLTHAGVTRREALVDVSAGGAFVRCAEPIPDVGDEIALQLRPPRALLGFTLRGRVAWQRASGPDAGFGVEFVVPDEATRARLEKLLARLS